MNVDAFFNIRVFFFQEKIKKSIDTETIYSTNNFEK